MLCSSMDGSRSGGLRPTTFARNLERALRHAKQARRLLAVLHEIGPATNAELAAQMQASTKAVFRLASRLRQTGLIELRGVRAWTSMWALPGQPVRRPRRPRRVVPVSDVQPATPQTSWWATPGTRDAFNEAADDRAKACGWVPKGSA